MSIGNWKHAPNVDAAAWACAEIWPRIRQTLAAAPAPAPAAPCSDSKQEGCRAALGSDLAASSSGTGSVGEAAASGSGGVIDSLPAGDSSRVGAATGARSAAALHGLGVGGEAGGGGAALAVHRGAAHAEALPEFHLYGAYESHAARALHAPERGVFVRGHAPTLEARRPATALRFNASNQLAERQC